MLKTDPRKKVRFRLWVIPVILILFVSALCYTSALWYVKTYGQIGFDSVLYTLFSDLGGVEKELVFSYVKNALLFAVCFTAVLWALLFFPSRRYLAVEVMGRRKFRLFPLHGVVSCILCLLICGYFLIHAAENVELNEYIESVRNPSQFYQEEYADPDKTAITFPEEKRNLIYIYLESMETTFFSQEQGGALSENVIPELYQLAQENINFSHNGDIGGFTSTTGTTWTIGAMVGHTAGVPLKTLADVVENEYGLEGGFLPGITTITDVLKENGYYQCLMVGSESEFGGRYQYYTGHGVDHVYDYNTAIEDGIIPSDYYVWWGMEDKYLFEYAKQELTEIASREEPFAFTMLTVDTHHIGGYVCSLCDTVYEEQYENVYACSSRQVYEFVKWIQQQDFYENTTIVLVGDHPSMDGGYMARAVEPGYHRRVYNCFINSAAEPENVKNRAFCAMDLFPTTLAAMGCTIEGDRLGLGTNLFSDSRTLIEKMGLDAFNQETAAFSRYYMEEFAQ